MGIKFLGCFFALDAFRLSLKLSDALGQKFYILFGASQSRIARFENIQQGICIIDQLRARLIKLPNLAFSQLKRVL